MSVSGSGRKRGAAFDIRLTPEAERHLDFLSARDRRIVLDAVEAGLRDQPAVETRNRKRLRPNPQAPWELRVGALRVYFDTESVPAPTVVIVAVGVKVRESLLIAGEEVDLG